MTTSLRIRLRVRRPCRIFCDASPRLLYAHLRACQYIAYDMVKETDFGIQQDGVGLSKNARCWRSAGYGSRSPKKAPVQGDRTMTILSVAQLALYRGVSPGRAAWNAARRDGPCRRRHRPVAADRHPDLAIAPRSARSRQPAHRKGLWRPDGHGQRGGGLAATDPKLLSYGALTATFHTGIGRLGGPSPLFLIVRTSTE